MQHQGKIPRGDTPTTLGPVSVETIQETSEILIFADIDGQIPQFVCNGRPLAINGAWLQLPVFEQIQQEDSNGLYRCPEVTL